MAAAVRTLSQTASRALNLNLKGIFVPLVTPFKSNGDIDFPKMESNVVKYEKEANLTGYLVGGTNSEVASLSADERVELVARVRKVVQPNKMILGGAYSESTKRACDLAIKMASAGADGVLVLSPFYFKKFMSDDVIASHFVQVADESPVPVVIYNNNWVTGIDMNVSLLTRLAKHPNIRGVKDSDIRKMGVTAKATKNDNFDVLAGSAGYLLPALQVGCSGGIIALAGPLAQECCQLYELIVAQRWQEALELHNRLLPIDYALPATHGVPGVKAAMDFKGFDCGYLRRPLHEVTEAVKNEIRDEMIQLGFLQK